MKWLIVIICFYAGFASGRTEEDQTLTVPQIVNQTVLAPDQCFYKTKDECPKVINPDDCPCKRIPIYSQDSPDEHAVYCCNLDSKNFENSLACVSKLKLFYLFHLFYINNDIFSIDYSNHVSYLHIRNATLESFNVTGVKWRRLKSLALTDGKIKRIQDQFFMMTPTHCLNLSNNGLLEIENNSFTRLTLLKSLDLSYNNITHLPAISGRELWIDISGKLIITE